MQDELEKWMRKAYELAVEAAARDEVPIGAVLVCEGRILATGSNRREEWQRTAAHAEMVALETYNQTARLWRLPPETSVFVTTEPCTMCTGALLWGRATNIYYGCSDPRNAGLTRLSPLIESGVYDHRFKRIQGGILETECRELLSGYFKKKRQG